MKITHLMTVFAVLTAAQATAGESFAYQGVLQDAKGAPLGNQAPVVTFRLYGDETGASAFWSRERTVRTDATGRFNVELDDSGKNAGGTFSTLAEAYAATLAKGLPLYLGLTLSGSSEIRPRQKILTTPRASVARKVIGASDTFTVGGAATVKGDAEFKTGATFRGRTFFEKKVAFGGKATFKKGVKIQKSAYGTMPVGTVVMWWSDKQPPYGWAICNGQTVDNRSGGKFQTPNLAGVFPFGKSSAYPAHGGAPTVSLTEEHLPSHTHEFPGHRLANCDGQGTFPQGQMYDRTRGFDTDSSKKMKMYRIGYEGGGKAHNNMPPYQVITFIVRVF